MHTPRFSGQLSSAGDFVLFRICSRPLRTNCENVGTFLLFATAKNANSDFVSLRFGTPRGAFAQAYRKI
jgi:hypothetical protein